MSEPKHVTEFALHHIMDDMRTVFFWADAPLAEQLRKYGNINRIEGNQWRLIVDGRYLFDEVVAYLTELDTSLTTRSEVKP